MDAVDQYVSQWKSVKPELDVSPMAVMGRLHRCAALVDVRLDQVFREHGMQAWEFDVLASLRRAGEPFELTPGALDRMTMMTSGTTTHRLKRLEDKGLVTRTPDPADRRVVRVRLTAAGRELFDAVHPAHLDNERGILDRLAPEDRAALLQGLTALAAALGDAAVPVPTPEEHA